MKLDKQPVGNGVFGEMSKASSRRPSTASTVRSRVTAKGDRLWRADDFPGLSITATSAELSRLARKGAVRRVAKGVYYRPGKWLMGETKPKSGDIVARAFRASIQPAGLTAANALGLTTQNTALPEVALAAAKAPVSLRGRAFIKTSRPASRASLSAREAAFLEVLRDRAQTSDLSPEETINRLQSVLRDANTLTRLARAAREEPPRVRAMLGALAESVGAPTMVLQMLRRTLNPISRFDFGQLGALSDARAWQAKSVKG